MRNEDDLKPIPYGITDFNDFRVKNYYYVDKTRYIRDIEKKGKFLFLIRPRRFGKSLFLGIMEAYYDIAYKERFDYLKLRHLIIIDQKGTVRANGNFSILQRIISAGSLHSPIIKNFSIEELTNPNHFISLLYYFGLLTIGGIDEENTPVLTIPNETVKRLYYDYFKDTYRETDVISLDMFQYGELVKGMAFRGNWRELVEYIAGRMEASLSLRDLITGEKALQVFWNVYLGLGPWYNVYAEREMGQGYCDLALVPMLIQYPTIKYSYLVEFKYIKPSENKPGNPQLIEKLKTEAESQLDRYSPDEKFQKAIGQTRLKRLVLIFCGHRLVYKGEGRTR